MARIAGVDLPRDKRVEIGLTYIYGIGLTLSKKILATTGINPDVRVRDLTEDDVAKIRNALEEYKVEGDLVQACRYAASARRPMRAPARARRKPSQARRLRRKSNVEGGITWLL